MALLSVESLRKIMPLLKQPKALVYLTHLNSAMKEAEINTPLRMAAFLAQLAHESAQLRYMEEIASGEAYDPEVNPKLAKRLGNTQPGDGKRYKGRGPIQLTGRANYRVAGKALGLDLENNPEWAAMPSVGFRVAAWYWNSRNLNALADQGPGQPAFEAITKAINGGLNGLADRLRYYERALAVFGVTTP